MKPLDPAKELRIIKSVFAIAGKKGLAGINIGEISKEAGVSVGTLYTYFTSKDDIIQKAYARIESQISHVIYAHFDITQPVQVSMKKIYVNIVNYRLKHYNENIFLDQYRQSDYIQLNYDLQLREFKDKNKSLFDLIHKGQEENTIRKLMPEMIVSFMIGTVRELVNAIAQKIFPLTPTVLDDGFTMLWQGIST